MSSQNMDEENPYAGIVRHRLTFDSSQQERRERQEREQQEEAQRIKQEKRKRKQDRRRAREEQERLEKEKAQKQRQMRNAEVQKYRDPAKMFEQDSSSGDRFQRIHNKINIIFPKYAKKMAQSSSQSDEDSQSEDEDSSSSSSSPKKKVVKTKKIEKRRNKEDESIENIRKKDKSRPVKIEEEMTGKDRLVQDVAVRWWYALPDWPEKDYDFEGELKKKGCRMVKSQDYKFVDEVVNGLTKVTEIDGYPGVYKGKFGLVDVRPKEQAPSLNYFYNKTEQELNNLLKIALQNQLKQLKEIKYFQSGQEKLITVLEKKIVSLK